MNYRVERIRSRPGRLREMGDRLTGGCVRALLLRLFMRARRARRAWRAWRAWLTGGGLRSFAKRQLRRLRVAGDRLTGGGLHVLAKRVVTGSLRRAVSQPFFKALGRSVLQPFPSFSARLYRLATAPDRAATTPDTVATTSTSLLPLRDYSLLVNSLYRPAFGRLAKESGLARHVQALQSGMSLESLAEDFLRSPEFRVRHGSSQEVDINYVTALYRDGLGRPPKLEDLAFWLAKEEKGATRAKVLARIAGSDEALPSTLLPAPETGMDYDRWVVSFDTISDADRAAIRAHIAGLPFHPVVSVIMPIGTTSEAALRESFNSVTTQLYPYWELCIAVDAVTQPFLSRVCGDSIAQDQRTKVTQSNDAEGVASAITAALSLATGEFVAFLKAGDILPEHALYQVAFELGRNERTDIVYTDHDQIAPDGKRSSPWFKAGWDPDPLLAQDYISNLVVYRRTLVEEIGSLRPGFEGAEFHDLALRAAAGTTSDRIRHVPAILYHRRDENKAIHSESALPALRALAASHRAVRDHLDSRGDTEALLRPVPQIPSAIRVIWPLPSPEPLVSVIIPTHDRAKSAGAKRRRDFTPHRLFQSRGADRRQRKCRASNVYAI
jgi:hypothetical protein